MLIFLRYFLILTILLLLLTSFSHSASFDPDYPECNVDKYEYERECVCKTRYSRFDQLGPNILPPTSDYVYCDNDDLKFQECYKGFKNLNLILGR